MKLLRLFMWLCPLLIMTACSKTTDSGDDSQTETTETSTTASSRQAVNLVSVYADPLKDIYDEVYDKTIKVEHQGQSQHANRLKNIVNDPSLKEEFEYAVVYKQYNDFTIKKILGGDNQTSQIHLARVDLETDTLRKFSVGFQIGEITAKIDEMAIHDIATERINGDDTTYVPVFISHKIADHVGQPHGHRPYVFNVSRNTGRSANDPKITAYQGTVDSLNIRLMPLGGQHIAGYVHCHEPINGRIIKNCDNTEAARIIVSSESTDGDASSEARYTINYPLRPVRVNLGANGSYPELTQGMLNNVSLIVPPYLKLLQQSEMVVDLIGITYIVKVNQGGQQINKPEKTVFYAVNPRPAD